MGKKFEKKIEDFKCFNCGLEVKGNGYTDHCPRCLYSLHVDVMPGDRNSSCKGVMKPVSVTLDRFGTYTISYVCTKCGAKKRVKASPSDSIEAIEAIAKS